MFNNLHTHMMRFVHEMICDDIIHQPPAHIISTHIQSNMHRITKELQVVFMAYLQPNRWYVFYVDRAIRSHSKMTSPQKWPFPHLPPYPVTVKTIKFAIWNNGSHRFCWPPSLTFLTSLSPTFAQIYSTNKPTKHIRYFDISWIWFFFFSLW